MAIGVISAGPTRTVAVVKSDSHPCVWPPYALTASPISSAKTASVIGPENVNCAIRPSCISASFAARTRQTSCNTRNPNKQSLRPDYRRQKARSSAGARVKFCHCRAYSWLERANVDGSRWRA